MEEQAAKREQQEEARGDGTSEEEARADEAAAESNGAAEEPTDEDLEAQLRALQEEHEKLNDRFLRQAAEFQNYRRRTKRDKERQYQSGKEDVLLSMLEVLDDFQRSLEAADEISEEQNPEEAYESLRDGVEMVYKKFVDELNNLGVEPIEAEGEPFDEELHEAMMQQPAPDDVEPGTVLQEIRKGYLLDDRVLRHSRVIVAE